MPRNRTYLAIIPARGGSKRLPRKNILPLADKPLVAWTIEAALQSSFINEVVVTSEDTEILEVSEKFGAKVLKRPNALAQDTSTSFDAVRHAIQNNPEHEYTVLLQPTSPFRNSRHIDEAIRLLEDQQADAVISVCKVEHSPLWVNTLPKDDNMSGFLHEEISSLRSQDCPDYYQLNGAIYICKTSELIKAKSFYLKENIYAYKMDQKSSVDIDTEIDFMWAKFILLNPVV